MNTEAVEKMKEVLSQEESLALSHFDHDDALLLGEEMLAKARREKKAISIDITKMNQQVFHAALPGTTADNDRWMKRKAANCYHFGHSSLFMHYKLKRDDTTYEKKYSMSSADFADVGGAIPIIVAKVGIVGAAAVSGLSHTEDHDFVKESLQWLKEKQQTEN